MPLVTSVVWYCGLLYVRDTCVDTVNVRLHETFMMVVMNERIYVVSCCTFIVVATNFTWPVHCNIIRILLLLLY